MSSFKWGSYDIDVLDGSYFPPHGRNELTEIKLIPAAGVDITEHNTVLQMGGRPRIEAPLKGILYSFEELNSLQDDDLTKVERLFTDAYGFSMQAVVKEFRIDTWKHNQVFEYSIIFLEV